MKRFLAAALIVACCGCETKSAPSAANVGDAKKSAAPSEPQAPVFAPPPNPNAKPSVEKSVEIEMIRVPARAGVTDKGKYDATIVGTPLTAHFSLQEQLIFDAAIPKALTLFEQSRNRKVSSQQEFMTEIVGKSNIRLPALPPQHRYVYDPQRGELMVEMPKGGN